MQGFANALNKIILPECYICEETRINMQGQVMNGQFSCDRCLREIQSVKWTGVHMYSEANDMSPGNIPPQLLQQGPLTPIEAMMLALVHPVIRVYKVRGFGQFKGGKGHVINFPQNPTEVFHIIPRLPHELPVVILRVRNSVQQRLADFEVNVARVRIWMDFLCEHNRWYQDIIRDVSRLNNYVDKLQHMSSQERFELLLDQDWNGGEFCGEILGEKDLTENLNIEETGVHVTEMRENEEAALERFLRLRPVSQNQPAMELHYPQVQVVPINEFTENGYIVKAFPGLFPYGKGDLVYTTNRPIKVSTIEYFRHLIRFRDGRFASDARFIFFALNTRYRSQLHSTAQYFVKKGQFEMLTVGELREEIANPLCNLGQRICRHAASIAGLAPFWHQVRRDLSCIVKFDCPHALVTFSAADTHWITFHDLIEQRRGQFSGYPIVHIQSLPEREAQLRRNQNLQQYPQLAAEFLYHRFTTFLDKVIYKDQQIKVKQHWFRFEWQFRGSGHLHGFLWVENAPTLSDINLDNSGDRLKLKTFWTKDRVRVDTLVKGLHPAVIHPCQHNLPLTHHLELDLSYLANRVQKHICGSYCLRRKRRQLQGDSIMHCRFHFPAVVQESTKVCKNPEGGWHLSLEGTEVDLDTNKYNPLYLQSWRANTDFQPILSLHAVLNYIAKYATKAVTASTNLCDLLRTAAGRCDDNNSVQSMFKKMLFTFAVERDFSAQEASHILRGLSLTISSWKVISLNLMDNTLVPIGRDVGVQLHEDEEAGNSLPKGILEKYISQGIEQEHLCLDELLRFYRYVKGSWFILTENIAKSRVIRCIPDPPADLNNSLFCRVTILRFIPFRSLAYLAGIEGESDDSIALNTIDFFFFFFFL